MISSFIFHVHTQLWRLQAWYMLFKRTLRNVHECSFIICIFQIIRFCFVILVDIICCIDLTILCERLFPFALIHCSYFAHIITLFLDQKKYVSIKLLIVGPRFHFFLRLFHIFGSYYTCFWGNLKSENKLLIYAFFLILAQFFSHVFLWMSPRSFHISHPRS